MKVAKALDRLLVLAPTSAHYRNNLANQSNPLGAIREFRSASSAVTMSNLAHASTWPLANNAPSTECCPRASFTGGQVVQCNNPSLSSSLHQPLVEGNLDPSLHTPPTDNVSPSTLTYAPYFPSQSDQHLPGLDFRPTFLETRLMIMSCLCYLGVTSCLIYLYYGSLGGRAWHITGTNAYLCWRYAPTTIGVITSKIFNSTLMALWRMLPYMAMADPKSRMGTGAPARVTLGAFYYPAMKPNTTLTWILSISRIVMGNIIAVKTALVAIEETDKGWAISLRMVPCFYLIGAHVTMCVVTFLIWIHVCRHPTGLRMDWDPVSLADVIALFYPFTRQSPQYGTMGGSRTEWVRAMILDKRRYRIGYWVETGPQELRGQITYGIGCLDEDADCRNHSESTPTDNWDTAPVDGDMAQHIGSGRHQRAAPYSVTDTNGGETSADVALSSGTSIIASGGEDDRSPIACCTSGPTCKHYAYRYTPFISTIWSIIGLCLALAGIAALAFVFYKDNFTSGWNYRLSADCASASNHTVGWGIAYWNSNSAASDNYHCSNELLGWAALFRFLPTYLANLVMGYMNQIDIHFRWTQPFVNMYRTPSTAYDTILLDYMTVSPLEVIPAALENAHWKVLLYCLLNALSWVLPVVTSGLCTLKTAIEEDGPWINLHISPWVAAACIALLSVYAAAIAMARPTLKRKLPRHVGCIFDLLCFFQNSHIRDMPVFERAACNPSFTKEHLKAQLFLYESRYQFGLIHGRNGHDELGFDIAEDKDGKTDHVEWFDPELKSKRSKYSDLRGESERIEEIEMQNIRQERDTSARQRTTRSRFDSSQQ